MHHLLLAAWTAVLDLLIKHNIQKKPASHFPRPLMGGRLILRRYHNTGAFLNLGHKCPAAIQTISGIIFAAFLGWFLDLLREPGRSMEKTAAALIAGGSLSNATDRLTRGFVVDYLTIPWKKLRHVIINLGDVAVFWGGILLVLDAFLHPAEDSSDN